MSVEEMLAAALPKVNLMVDAQLERMTNDKFDKKEIRMVDTLGRVFMQELKRAEIESMEPEHWYQAVSWIAAFMICETVLNTHSMKDRRGIGEATLAIIQETTATVGKTLMLSLDPVKGVN